MTKKINIRYAAMQLGLFFLLLLNAGNAYAQTVTRAVKLIAPSSTRQVIQKAGTVSPGQAPELPLGTVANGEAVVEETKSPRLTKTLLLQFNRSPVSVLKAWSLRNNPPTPERKKPVPPGPDTPAEILERTQKLVQQFEQNIILSDWDAAKTFLAGFKEKEEAKEAYNYVLRKLSSFPTATGVASSMSRGVTPDDHVMKPDDLLGIVSIAPMALEKTNFQTIGNLLARSRTQGYDLVDFLAKLKTGIGALGGKDPITRLNAATVLVSAGLPIEAMEFLNSPEEAYQAKDVDSLMLLSSASRAQYSSSRKPELLESAWKINQMVLALPEIDDAEKNKALQVAVSLAPKVREDLGQTWMDGSFTSDPKRGIQIIAGIGEATFNGQATNRTSPATRIEGLKLQKNCVETLLRSTGKAEKAEDWFQTVDLLAKSWLKEATFSQRYAKSSGVSSFRRDRYGNIFYANDDEMMGMVPQQSSRNRPVPINVRDVLELRPEGEWFEGISDNLKTKFRETYARLYLKNSEEEKAFPLIETITATDKKLGKSLIEEFLTVWTRNHNPNASNNNRNSYIYFFGFEQRANSIPLTRSKQQRNLAELKKWISRMRKLELDEIDEEKLVRAFTTCHSTAEVYRIEDIEEVFGSIDSLKSSTIAGLVQKMRTNLTTSWRKPATQQKSNTNRKEPEIKKEVLRGYDVAEKIVRNALIQDADNWELKLAKACVIFDKNSYAQEVQKSSEFTLKQKQVYGQFADAAATYSKAVESLEEDEQNTKVFDLWFYAALGACDLSQLDHKKLSAEPQFSLIRQAIDKLPGEAPTKHLSQFANKLFTRMSPLKPEMKYRYLKGGFEIVGDHKDAWEAKKVFQYYKDLVSEIQLRTEIDGSDIIGEKPFGMFVHLYHTEEVERESGGFAKYLQNQNNMQNAYNYGRPTNDYRDAFETSAISALSEQFEVISVTFEDEKNLESREDVNPGWRITPYAYILMKARGKEVDMIPPVKLDLDFLDTSGYAVLPIESKAIPVDTVSDIAQARPMTNLEITQTLDERRAGEGKLVLEVKATAHGLIPDFDEILELNTSEFDPIDEQDQGVSVSAFDPESNEIQMVTEREWLIELKARDDAGKPKEFEFCTSKISDAELSFKRYQDADLVDVEPVVSLENDYGQASRAWIYWLAGGVPLVLILVGLVVVVSRMPTTEIIRKYSVPAEVTPLNVISLLKQIRGDEKLSIEQQRQLDTSIDEIEQHFFYTQTGNAPDIKTLAHEWVAKVA